MSSAGGVVVANQPQGEQDLVVVQEVGDRVVAGDHHVELPAMMVVAEIRDRFIKGDDEL